MSALLEAKDLKKYFKTPKGMLHAVDGVSFTSEEGETLGIVGESGCGKSTLGRMMVQLHESTSGQIFYKGRDVTNLSRKELKAFRSDMQMIFQDPFSSLNPRMTVYDTIAEPLRNYKDATEGKSIEECVKKLMDTVFNELVLAGIMMGPEEFTIMWICLTFGPSGISALLGANPIASITMAVLGCVVPLLFINFKKGKRRKAFEAQLSDALMVICNCLRSGLSFQQAIETIAKDMPAPIGVEFSRVCSEIQYGETLETALNNMANRIKSSDLLIAVSAVSIQRQTGGNLSKILDTISVTIKDRLKIKSEISALTAQGRTSGMIIGALPIVVAGMLMIIASDYMSMFFTTKVGRIMLVVAAVMEVLGFFAIRKVVSIEY